MRLTLAALAATLALAAPTDARPPRLYRSLDGNTVTIQLFNRGAATWAAGRGGSSGARPAYTTAVGNNSRISARRSRRPASEGQQAGGGCYIMPGTLAACGWAGAWHGGGRRLTRGLRTRLFQQLAASSVLGLGRAEL